MKYYTDKRKKTLAVSYGLRSQSYGLFIFDYEKGKNLSGNVVKYGSKSLLIDFFTLLYFPLLNFAASLCK